MLSVRFALALLVVMAGCSAVASSQATRIGPDRFDALAAQPDATVINVHVPRMQDLPGTDDDIAFTDIAAIEAAAPDKDAPVVLYCKGGAMSEDAAQRLLLDGYTQVYTLSGGSNAYLAVKDVS